MISASAYTSAVDEAIAAMVETLLPVLQIRYEAERGRGRSVDQSLRESYIHSEAMSGEAARKAMERVRFMVKVGEGEE